ncbi:uncharacterized protein CC84DRAFT_1213314 [Paraphaeosphaeria sporulosa]|uniref:Uncharacterized protein n=1 Tax=Paraphaeosphaeria sporulosa TaxID=1460663 RepID=A0A177CT41_9PLEO|nr:uncharacterized protein CC84DRAFT_1213314 [Paraphaeosphaeria sporulosa]OAG09937.1 hypothetical protein CC84DRAFT_1213314 [Paraphaeosphaeria sporulosa]
MPRSKSKSKNKLARDELEDRFEEEAPWITDRMPSVSSFKFFTDRTTQENVYVKVGEAKVDKTKVGDTKVEHELVPVYVGLGDVTGSRMITFNVRSLYPERIIHESKELSRIKTIYNEPFDRLLPLQYEYPSASYANSLQWVTELRALTMFAFVWCGHRAEFFDFNKGEGFRVLVEVLKRRPKATGAAAKRDAGPRAQKSAEAEGPVASVEVDLVPGVIADANTNTDLALHMDKDKEMDTESGTGAEDNAGMIIPMSATVNVPSSGQDASTLGNHASKKRKLMNL